MEFRKIAVIGAGLMGHGIAEVFAIKGYQVSLYDVYEEALKKAKDGIENSLQRMVKSGRMSETDAVAAGDRIRFSSDLPQTVSDADLIVEAVPESVELKHRVIKEIEESCRQDAVIATNTSNIRITELASVSARPQNIVGMHFFNPPIRMQLVEVVKGEKTSDESFAAVADLTAKIGKSAVKVLKDTPGFVVNRVRAPEMLLFCMMLDNNVAPPAEIDKFAKSQGLPMGPYELMDYVGIDTAVHSLNYYSKELSPDYAKCQIFRKMVGENKLGRKTGEGFYIWEGDKAKIPDAKATDKVQLLDVLALEVNEAVKLIEDGVSSPDDIENGVKLGYNMPFGPIAVAQGLTNKEIKEKLESLYEKFQVSVFKPAKSIEQGLLKEAIAGKLGPAEEKKAEAAIPLGETPAGDRKVNVIRSGMVATIELSNGRLNLLSQDLIGELDEAITEISTDREVRVVVIRGRGDNFSAGMDLSQFVTSPVDVLEGSRRGQKVFKKLTEMPQITIAMVRGYALGGGMELSLAADMRFATPDAQFGQTEVLRGLVPGWGGSQRLTRLTGFSRAAYLVLSGDRISGKDACDYGIVLNNFSGEAIADEVMKLAARLSETVSPSAARVAKMLLYKGSEVPLDDGLDMEALSTGLLYGTEDFKEGVAAFLQKRKPEFKNR